MKTKIGKVSATEKSPTTVNEFSFWLEEGVEVKPFDIIKQKSILVVKNQLHME